MTEVLPNCWEFAKLAKRFNVIPVCREIVVDRLTPVSVYERLSSGEPYSFLLESVDGGERLGRYSFVGQRPYAVFSCQKNEARYREIGGSSRRWPVQNPVKDLKAIFSRYRPSPLPNMPRFWGGAVGFWDYDTVRYFERLPDGKPDKLGLPAAAFQFSRELVVFDRLSQTAKVMVCVHVPDGTNQRDLKKLYMKAVADLERQIQRMHDFRRSQPTRRSTPHKAKPVAITPRQIYLEGVKRGKEYIQAGDLIQVVLSQRWMIRPAVSPFQIYRALRLLNPSPYMYCFHFEDVDIVGSSPELLVRKEGTIAETRPIAGTRPRGATPEEDARLEKELLADAKERAEHLMLVDLGRNDLGRTCLPGSVTVQDFMSVERYSHVMHLVSSVTGKLGSKVDAFDVFRACFPAGTVSGAPKIRAMQIIDELEPVRRGPYAGSLGYFSYDGNMDMAITIRTLVFHKGVGYLQAGAGIVADSDPEKEYRECEHKAAALWAAVDKAANIDP